MNIHPKSPYQIEQMKETGQIVARAHAQARSLIRPGITTWELDQQIEAFIITQGARSSLKGYRGFPTATSICLNDEAIHGIPGARVLRSGDICTIDICVNYRGYHGDSAWSYAVGSLNRDAERLLRAAEQALWSGIDQVQTSLSTSGIGRAAQAAAEAMGYSIVPDYGGHGIGRRLHERPFIPMTGSDDNNVYLQPGMTFTIEPILCSAPVRLSENRWTVMSVDGSLTAQFEHTIAITEAGTMVLTVL
jgi:methionyl aminopeptidase